MSNIDVDSKRFIFHLMVGSRAVGRSENIRLANSNPRLFEGEGFCSYYSQNLEGGRGAIDPLAPPFPTALGSNLLCQADCRSPGSSIRDFENGMTASFSTL